MGKMHIFPVETTGRRTISWIISRGREARTWLVPIILVGAACRIPLLFCYHYSPGEVQQVVESNLPSVADMIDGLRWQLHPPTVHLLRHAMLQISHDAVFQRLLGLVPGLLLIWACWLLGRLVAGSRIGLLCAALAALSPAGIVLSATVHSYLLIALLLTLALAAFVAWDESRGRRQLVLFGTTAAAAAAAHYAALVVVGALGLAGLASLARRRARLVEVAAFAASLVPTLVVGAVCTFVHLGHALQNNVVSRWQDNLAHVLGGDPLAVFDRLLSMLGFLHGPLLGWLWVTLLVVGVVALARAKPVLAVAMTVLLAASVIFTLVGYYPLGPVHQAVFLFPVTLVGIAYGLGRLAARLRPSMTTRNMLLASGIIAVAIGSRMIGGDFRAYLSSYVSSEGFLATDDYRALVQSLTDTVRPGEIGFTTGYTANYLQDLSRKSGLEWTDDYCVFEEGGVRWYFPWRDWVGKRKEELRRIACAVKEARPFPRRIHFLHIGWVLPESVIPALLHGPEAPETSHIFIRRDIFFFTLTDQTVHTLLCPARP